MIVHLRRGLRDKVIAWFESQQLSRQETVIMIERVLNELDILWMKNEVPLTVIYLASRIIEDLLQKWKEVEDFDSSKKGVIVIGTLVDDYHSLGKNITKRILSPFFEIHDLGCDVGPEAFVQFAKSKRADFIAISALMLNSVVQIRDLRKMIDSTSWDKKPHLLVGGAPFTLDSELYTFVGADCYSKSALDAANTCLSMLGGI